MVTVTFEIDLPTKPGPECLVDLLFGVSVGVRRRDSSSLEPSVGGQSFKQLNCLPEIINHFSAGLEVLVARGFDSAQTGAVLVKFVDP
ncbi:hypothetical protein OGATHE_004715 [Ogataea polymorpha]|uniref:Uncharacterized protein n=1 Tax=Ogataea polymorpha TaxID=460523 RepID=A0A9P8T2F9_9ASCO|nr:hypothetical protein OGATHE_004715 [Ogataea polymorpha]